MAELDERESFARHRLNDVSSLQMKALMRRATRSLIGIALLLALMPPVTHAMVKGMAFREAVERSDLIVVGNVVRVFEVEGVRLAELDVQIVMKGQPPNRPTFVAQSMGFACDISSATEGERVFILLSVYKFHPKPDLDTLTVRYIPWGDDSVATVGADLEGDPIGFEEAVENLGLNGPLYCITHSGRGRLPIHVIEGVERVTFWTDIGLHRVVQSEIGPDGEDYDFIRSAALADIFEAVELLVEETQDDTASLDSVTVERDE